MKNKKVTWALTVLVIAIWGAIAYQVYASMAGADEEAQVRLSVPGSETGEQANDYVYLADVRDPFRFVVAARKDTAKKTAAAAQKPVWTPPPMKLTGILRTGKRKTVMLEGNDGSVFFLHEGDTLKGIKLLKIGDLAVSYLYQKKKDEWVMQRN